MVDDGTVKERFESLCCLLNELANGFPDPIKQPSPIFEQLWTCKSLVSELYSISFLFRDTVKELQEARREHLRIAGWDGDAGEVEVVVPLLKQIDETEKKATALFKLIYLLGHQILESARRAIGSIHKFDENQVMQFFKENPQRISPSLVSSLPQRRWLDAQFNWLFFTFLANEQCSMTMDRNGLAFLVFITGSGLEEKSLTADLFRNVPQLKTIQCPVGLDSEYDKALRALNVFDVCDGEQQTKIKDCLSKIGCVTPSADELIERLLNWLLHDFTEIKIHAR